VGRDRVGGQQDWLLGTDLVQLGALGRARSGPSRRGSTAERQRVKELERENRELRRANEILRNASAFFAQAELDRRPK
jgi:transposase-like protein